MTLLEFDLHGTLRSDFGDAETVLASWEADTATTKLTLSLIKNTIDYGDERSIGILRLIPD